MPKLSALSGNFLEVTKKVFPNTYLTFTDENEGSLNQILVDLPRAKFIESNGKTFDDLVDVWTSPHVTTAYSQGILTGSFYKFLHTNFLVPIDNPSAGAKILKRRKTRPTIQRLFPEEYLSDEDIIEKYGSDFKEISFAFFDDHGIPCALDIRYSLIEPDLWTATIFRNTTAAPENRFVFLLGSDEIIGTPSWGKREIPKIVDSFQAFARSQQIEKLLHGFIRKNGGINTSKFDDFSVNNSEYQITENALKKVVSMGEQSSEIGKWELNDNQFFQVKNILEERLNPLQQSYEVEHKAKLRDLDEKIETQLNIIDQKITRLANIAKQPFYKRHNIVPVVSSLSIGIGLALILSGIFAPSGIVLIGILFYLGFGAMILSGITAIRSAIKIGLDEKKLLDDRQQLDSSKDIIVNDGKDEHKILIDEYNTKLQEISIENNPERLSRTGIAAKFSSEEFIQFKEQIFSKSSIAPKLDDIKQVESEILEEIKEEFTQPTSVVLEAPAPLLKAEKSVNAVAEEINQLIAIGKLHKIAPSDDPMENSTTRSVQP